MATPAQNAEILMNYWSTAVRNKDNTFERAFKGPEALYRAGVAMRELVRVAADNPYVRQSVFAAEPIFSTALLKEPMGYTDWLIFNADRLGAGPQSIQGKILIDQLGGEPPRLTMLRAIYEKANGGFFSAQDPSGLTSWISSVEIAGAGIAFAIADDPNSAVRAAALRMVADLAIPAVWAQTLLSTRALDDLDEQLPRSPWSQPERIVLQTLSQRARARLLQIQAIAAQAALPTFPTGDGSQVPTAPPVPKPWYKRGQTIGAAAVGVMAGAALHTHSKRRAAT